MTKPIICPRVENTPSCSGGDNAVFSLGLRLVAIIFAIVLGFFIHWAQAATYSDPRPTPQLDNAVTILDAIRADNREHAERNAEKSKENSPENPQKNQPKTEPQNTVENTPENAPLNPDRIQGQPHNPYPLPVWAQWVVGILAVAGAAIALLGSLGLLRLRTYYERVHTPSIIATMGCWLTMWAVVIFFSASGRGPAFSLLLIAIFVGVTVPITTIFLMRAALFRSRRMGENVPPTISRVQPPKK